MAKIRKILGIVAILTAVGSANVAAQCPNVKCGEWDDNGNSIAEFGIGLYIPDSAYLPLIVDTNESCYVVLQVENQQLNSLLAEYDILDFYKYIDGITELETAYRVVVDSMQQMELYAELVENFSDAFPYIEHYRCQAMIPENGFDNIHSNNYFWQDGNNLVFGEAAEKARTINFYSLTGIKICTLKSMEKIINLSSYLINSGIYIVEVIENNQRYSLKINFLDTK
jgi:hypothetical protein